MKSVRFFFRISKCLIEWIIWLILNVKLEISTRMAYGIHLCATGLGKRMFLAVRSVLPGKNNFIC
jgi:hypothetical protein